MIVWSEDGAGSILKLTRSILQVHLAVLRGALISPVHILTFEGALLPFFCVGEVVVEGSL